MSDPLSYQTRVSLNRCIILKSHRISSRRCVYGNPGLNTASWPIPWEHNDWLQPALCGLQNATKRLIDRDEQEYTQTTEVFAYGVFVGTMTLLVLTEIAGPTRWRVDGSNYKTLSSAF